MTSSQDKKKSPSGRFWFGWSWWVWAIIVALFGVAQPMLEALSHNADPIANYDCYASDGRNC